MENAQNACKRRRPMEIRFDRAKWMQDSEGDWLSLRVQDWGAAKNFAAGMKDAPYIARLSQKREHRSLDANGYLWVLCQKIAEAAGITKEEVYLDAVRHAGQFEYLPIRADALEAFKRRWNGRGDRMAGGNRGRQQAPRLQKGHRLLRIICLRHPRDVRITGLRGQYRQRHGA